MDKYNILHNTNNKTRIAAIDGWRFLFALLIVWHHLPWGDGMLHTMGWVPVSFFLIVSGYLSQPSDTSNLSKYYLRKFFRIFPIYWICLVVSLILTIPIRSFWTIDNLLGILKNIFMFQAYFPTDDVDVYLNLPAWFLSVLVLFYVLLPFFQKLQQRNPHGFAIGVGFYYILVVIITWLFWGGSQQVRVFNPLARISECMIGMVLAYYLKNKNVANYHKYLSLILLVVFIFVCRGVPLEYVRPYLAIPVMAYLCVSWVYVSLSDRLSAVCNKMGMVSMEVYMWHVLVILGLIRVQDIVGIELNKYVLIVLVYIITLLFAFLYKT